MNNLFCLKLTNTGTNLQYQINSSFSHNCIGRSFIRCEKCQNNICDKCEIKYNNHITNILYQQKKDKYINIHINYNKFSKLAEMYFKNKKTFLSKKVLIECFSVNVGKSIHIGHLRSLFIGNMISNIYKHFGCNVTIDSHLGDYGSNMSVFMDYFTKEENQQELHQQSIDKLSKIYVENKSTYNDEKIKLIEYKKDIYNKILSITINNIKQILNMTSCHIDIYNSEYMYVHLCRYLMEKYKKNKIIKKNNKNQIIIQSKYKNTTQDLVILKSNDIPIYSFTDIACMYDRIIVDQYDEIVYCIDDRQNQHVEMFQNAFNLIYKHQCQVINIMYGVVSTKFGILSSHKSHTMNIQEIYSYMNQKYNMEINDCINILKMYILKHSYNSEIKISNNEIGMYSNIYFEFIECVKKIKNLIIENNPTNHEEEIYIDNIWKAIEYLYLIATNGKQYNIHNYVHYCMLNIKQIIKDNKINMNTLYAFKILIDILKNIYQISIPEIENHHQINQQ